MPDPWTASKSGLGRVVDEYSFERIVERARSASTLLRRSRIPHAIAGGLAVHALVWEVNGGSAHAKGNIDLLLNRDDLERAQGILKSSGREAVDLKSVLTTAHQSRKHDAIRFIAAGEKLRERYTHTTPKLEGHYCFPSLLGFECLLLEPLLTMKLTSFRLVDQVHIQDLLEEHLLTPKIESALPEDLQARLKEVKEETERER
jgi:hypothetical protein